MKQTQSNNKRIGYSPESNSLSTNRYTNNNTKRIPKQPYNSNPQVLAKSFDLALLFPEP